MSPFKIWINGYGCTSSAGPSTELFWSGLCQGVDHSALITTESWPIRPRLDRLRACKWASSSWARFDNPVWNSFFTETQAVTSSNAKVLDKLVHQLLNSWQQASQMMGPKHTLQIQESDKLGVIFASTKGIVDDFIWEDFNRTQTLPINTSDPLTPVLNRFLEITSLRPKKSLCVSNACTSVLSAAYLAQRWISTGKVSDVLILAADQVGAFVVNGFHSLNALSSSQARPFDRLRDGFNIGEASAAIVLSAAPVLKSQSIELEPVGLDVEGFAATRPSVLGDSLLRACLQIPMILESPPDLIISHGTATVVNDQIEDQVFSKLFEHCKITPSITGTKWSIGHTLGVSGAMDLIAACKVIETNRFFNLENTSEVDPTFRGRYLTSGLKKNDGANQRHFFERVERVDRVERVMISSLGFGGVHAAASLRRGGGG